MKNSKTVTIAKSLVSSIKKSIDTKNIDIKEIAESLSVMQEGHQCIVDAIVVAQDKAKTFIEKNVTYAIQTIWDGTYEFKLDYVIKRNQAEATPRVICDGVELTLKDDETGGGLLDVCAFVMRICLWALQSNRTARTFILDEPFKFLSRDKIERISEVLKKLSETLNIQLIIVSHEMALIDAADKNWKVQKSKKISTVIEMEN